MTPSLTSGADRIAQALRDAGADVAFGLPGVHNLALWPACEAAGVRIVGVRHEQTAAYAADGLARATGRLGAALTTTGPGAANTVAATGEAWAAGSPVVVVATDIATTIRRDGVHRGALHECTDQPALFAPVTKATFAGAAVRAALLAATSAPTRPVYVNVPTDFLSGEAAASLPAPAARRDGPDPGPVAALVEAARRPFLWVGGGARAAGDVVRQLAERLQAPVVTSYLGRGVLPYGHPLLVAAPPHEPAVTALIRSADLAIVVGSDLDQMNTMGWRLPLPERRVAVNVDPIDAAKNYPMDAVLEGDCAHSLPGLIGAVAAREPATAWPPDLAALERDVRAAMPAAPRRFLDAVDAALPHDAVVFADMCIPGYWLAGYHRVRRPRGLHYPMGWGTLGWAFPAAIGAATALRDDGRAVVSVSGDGGFLFAIGELATIAQERIPLTVVVVDDGGYGMLRWGHEAEANGSDLVSPDFAAVAAGFGIRARHVEGLAGGFATALAEAVGSGEPNLVHVTGASLEPPLTTSPRWPLR